MKTIFIIFLLSITINSLSQTAQEFGANEMKYWKLRGRLIGDDKNRDIYNGFMVIGEQNGMSVPSSRRFPIGERSYYVFDPLLAGECKYAEIANTLVGSTALPIIDSRDGLDLKGIIAWSDNPLVEIGTYLQILAMEWALLHRSNASTSETEKEIYYALKAVKRLDGNAESLYGLNSVNNGFLMREDVSSNFALNNMGKNMDMVLSHTACPDATGPQTKSPMDCATTSINNPLTNAMSQDEVVGLFAGFSFIDKMMPNYPTYNGQNLKDLTKELCFQILQRLRNDFWFIRDPKDNKLVCRGPNALFYSYPLMKIGVNVNNTPMTNIWAQSVGKQAWNIQKLMYYYNNITTVMFPIPTPILNQFPDINSHYPITGIANPSFDHSKHYVLSMMLRLLACSKSGSLPSILDFTGREVIGSISQTYFKQIYDLMGSVMKGYTPQLGKNYWHDEFNALSCGCNCTHSNNSTSYFECDYHKNDPYSLTTKGRWNLEDRWADPNYNNYNANGLQPSENIVEFNGLDYMLAYNMYRWKYFNKGYDGRIRGYCYNKIIPFESLPNPYDNNHTYWIGSASKPYNSKAVFSIEIGNSTCQSNSNLTLTAGSDIKLKPGFNVLPGGVFHAQIKEYDCTPNVIPVPNASYVGWKTDSLEDGFFDYQIDTMENIQLDEDSTDVDNDTAYNNLIIWNQVGDTVWGTYNQDYIITIDTIIYAPQNNNKEILENLSTSKINLYPNPTSENATLEYTLYANTKVQVYVTNELGEHISYVVNEQIVEQNIGKQQVALQTAHLASGIYFCNLLLNGKRIVKKFTVVH